MCNIFILILHQFFKYFILMKYSNKERLNKKMEIEIVFVLVL